ILRVRLTSCSMSALGPYLASRSLASALLSPRAGATASRARTWSRGAFSRSMSVGGDAADCGARADGTGADISHCLESSVLARGRSCRRQGAMAAYDRLRCRMQVLANSWRGGEPCLSLTDRSAPRLIGCTADGGGHREERMTRSPVLSGVIS